MLSVRNIGAVNDELVPDGPALATQFRTSNHGSLINGCWLDAGFGTSLPPYGSDAVAGTGDVRTSMSPLPSAGPEQTECR